MDEVYFYCGYVLAVAYSIIFHEVAHGVAALLAGDDTARISGRITLNPIPHVDLFGTIILPGLLIVTRSPVVFGWARPVPVNPLRFRRPVRDDIAVSLAGIGVNLLLAYCFILLRHLSAHTMNERLFVAIAVMNISLAVFNLVPVPPLDGSHVFKYLLPRDARRRYEDLALYGGFLIFFFLLLGGELLNVVISTVFSALWFLGGHG